MTTFPHEVSPLFAEPYFRASIAGAINPEQITFIKNLKMVNNQGNLISENLYIFEKPELKSIKDAVQEALDIYARDVMCIPQKLYVTQSWAMTNNMNVGMPERSYSNSVVSGSLYYCEMPSPPARMVFSRYVTYQQIDLAPEIGKRNFFNTPVTRITPNQDEVILFSSQMTHMVEANTASQPRHSIAFNAFVKGKLGNYSDASELAL